MTTRTSLSEHDPEKQPLSEYSGEDDCRVYWASHGCRYQRSHDEIHQCSCGCTLESWMPTYGEDAIEHDTRVHITNPPPGWKR